MSLSTRASSKKLSAITLRHLKTAEEAFLSSGLGDIAPPFFRSLKRFLSRSADDGMAMTNLLRFVEASFNPTSMLRDLTEHTVLLETLLSIFGSSQYFSDILIRDPELFRWLTATSILKVPQTKETYRTAAQQSIDAFQTLPRKVNALKRFQRRELLRIGVRDLLHLSDLETATLELSTVADVIIALTADLALHELRNRYGVAPDSPWAIVGLGKLGGNELNYSSDVDLMAVYEYDGELLSPTAGKMSHGEFFVRFVENIVHILSHPTEEGHLYRVDLRLRPDGKAGALIRSLASALTYYESRGELWERQMLIKARCVAGNEGFAKRFTDALAPFVYPRALFRDPSEEIARIKSRIEADSDERNIKLRSGGIRDIEFIVQALQLVNGGRNPTIRTGNTVAGLRALRKMSLLSKAEAEQLEKAYLFYRLLEHRLQMLEYAQTHTLPPRRRDRERLAARMAFSPAKFEEDLQRHLRNVRRIFNAVFTRKASPSEIALIRFVQERPDSEFSRAFARRFGLHDAAKAARNLRGMMYGSDLLGTKQYTAKTHSLFEEAAETFLKEIASSLAPDRALENARRLFTSSRSPDAIYSLLSEKSFRRAFVTICARSEMLTKQLALSPELAESALMGIQDYVRDDALPRPRLEAIHRWKVLEECKAAIRYVLDEKDERQLFSSLTQVASQTLSLLLAAERRSLGISPDIRFCILGLGKLGGNEITFSSDLDVVFLFDARRRSDAEKCERLASNIIAACSRVTQDGKLYDVDARLRPEGRNAPLAVAAKQYLEYLQHRASLWERQSLTRARVIAGEAEFCAALLNSIHDLIYTRPLPADWKQEIISMRRKTETRSRTSSADFFDIKLGAGGMMDIEFAVQFLQLSRGADALPSTNMYELLENYSRDTKHGKRVVALKESYALKRKIETALRVGLDSRTHIIPADKESLDYLAQLTGFDDGSNFMAALRKDMKETRSTFESMVLAPG